MLLIYGFLHQIQRTYYLIKFFDIKVFGNIVLGYKINVSKALRFRSSV